VAQEGGPAAVLGPAVAAVLVVVEPAAAAARGLAGPAVAAAAEAVAEAVRELVGVAEAARSSRLTSLRVQSHPRAPGSAPPRRSWRFFDGGS
jgi:hypothetical protein